MDKFNIRNIAAAIIIFFSICLIFRLDKTEIQPWDEGLYAMRALGINQYGNIWDQTPHSIGGLYSSTYPPLTVWIMALNMKFMEPHVSVRLFSAVCGAAALIFIFLISRRFLSGEMSLAAMIGLAVTIAWYKYSRQGMTDVPLMTFALISLWIIIKLIESNKVIISLLFSFLFVLVFAAGLMTKVLISFLPLLFVLIALKNLDSKKRIFIAVALVAGIGLAFPWHWYMIQKYGFAFYKVFTASHIYTSVENNSPLLGIFYYINQLIITNPFLILSIIFSVLYFVKRKVIEEWLDETGRLILKILITWFGLILVVFSLSMTKLPHYTLYMIVPGILLSAFFYEKATDDKFSASLKWWIFSAIILAFLWSISYELRQELKELTTLKGISWKSIIYLLLLIFLVAYSFRATLERKAAVLNLSFTAISYFVLIILVIRIVFISVMFNEGNISGGMETSYYLEQTGRQSFIYMYHEYNASDSLNPQLAWYSKGWTCGWRKDKTFIPVSLPRNSIKLKTILDTDKSPRDYIVYYIPEDKILSEAVIMELIGSRPIIRKTRNYILFGPVMFKRKMGFEI